MTFQERLNLMGSRSKVTIALLMAATATAGCGDPSTSTGGSASSAEGANVPPATGVATPVSEPGGGEYVTMTGLEASEVDEPCPTDEPVEVNETEPSIAIEEGSRLEPMAGVVLQYGREHPDVFGGYGFHWHSTIDASVFVSFTGDLAEHRAALAGIVEYPDELIVCQAPASEADRNAIQATLGDELSGRVSGIGSGGKAGAVTVRLNPNEEALAAELVERYGAAIDVTVGALEFPITDAVAVCGPLLVPSLIEGLQVRILDGTDPVATTETGTAALSIRLTNTGDAPIRFGSGHPSTVITDADGKARTLDTRAREDVGIEIALEPGESMDFDIDVSLASCDPADGYLLPPGPHYLVVSFYNDQLQSDMTSEPFPVTIVEP